jgi:putative membrane protein
MSLQQLSSVAVLILALGACRSQSDREVDSYRQGQQASSGTSTSSTSSTGTTTAQRQETRSGSSIEAAAGRAGRVTADERSFVNEAASGGRFEVESSQLALEKARDDAELLQFAQRMIEDHTRANKELEQIASRKGLAPAQTMSSRHAMLVDRLRGLESPEFAREFRMIQVEAHRDTIDLFERAARGLSDPDLKSFAQRTLPTLRAHLAHLQEEEPGSDVR